MQIVIRLKEKLVLIRNYFVCIYYRILAVLRFFPLPMNEKADFVVAMASYPERIHQVPIVIESIARQTIKPRKIYLILTDNEWPGKIIPFSLQRLEGKGLEIIWTPISYNVKKLIPVLIRHPDLSIITVDDDFIFEKKTLEYLVNTEKLNPRSVVGYFGKAIYRKGRELGMMFRQKAGPKYFCISDDIYMMSGCTLYSNNSLDKRVLNMDGINKIVPGRGSDIWFWAASVAANSAIICIKKPGDKKVGIPIPENKKTITKHNPGAEELEKKFQASIDYFGIREKLIETLPEFNDLN